MGNLSRSFVLTEVRGLALYKPLSWPRQDPPITIWLLLELVDGMQARLRLPSAKLRPHAKASHTHTHTHTHTDTQTHSWHIPDAQRRKLYNVDGSFHSSGSPRFTAQWTHTLKEKYLCGHTLAESSNADYDIQTFSHLLDRRWILYVLFAGSTVDWVNTVLRERERKRERERERETGWWCWEVEE